MFRCVVAEDPSNYNLSDFPLDTSQLIEKYNVSRVTNRFAPGNHEPYTHVFSFARDVMRQEFPLELMEICSNSPPAEFMRFWPPEADEIFPESHKLVLDRVKKTIPEMPEHEQVIFRSWKSVSLDKLAEK